MVSQKAVPDSTGVLLVDSGGADLQLLPCCSPKPMWGFPKIGDPSIVP